MHFRALIRYVDDKGKLQVAADEQITYAPGTHNYRISASIPANVKKVEGSSSVIVEISNTAAWSTASFTRVAAQFQFSETVTPSPTTPATGRSFSDLATNHWAYENIMEMVEIGILSGYPDGTFKPNNTITRAEFAKIMVLALNLDTASPSVPTFTDVPANHWAYGVVESARNYLTGYRDTRTGALTFEPNSVAVREDVAVALVNAKGLGNARANLSLLDQFHDKDQISEALRNHVAIAVEQGYMRGTNIGFEPQKALTRAEACALLSRIIDRGGKEKIAM
ncbi:MAG: S-layer homology domain-containing protein [Bacillota bacterium]